MITVRGWTRPDRLAYAAAITPGEGFTVVPDSLRAAVEALGEVTLTPTGPLVPVAPADPHSLVAALMAVSDVVAVEGDVPDDPRTKIPDGAVA